MRSKNSFFQSLFKIFIVVRLRLIQFPRRFLSLFQSLFTDQIIRGLIRSFGGFLYGGFLPGIRFTVISARRQHYGNSGTSEKTYNHSFHFRHLHSFKTGFKIICRNRKSKLFQENRPSYHQSDEYIEERFAHVEKKFSLFEEWMFASEFDKAHEQLMEISADIEELTDQLHDLPSLYEQARGVLPRAIDEIGLRYAQTRNKGVYLEHLEVQKNLDIISDQLKDNLNRLRNGSLTDVKSNLDAMNERLASLQELIVREDQAYDEIHNGMEDTFRSVKRVNEMFAEIVQLYQRVNERFGFEDWSVRLAKANAQLEEMNGLVEEVRKTAEANKIASSTQLVEYRELVKSVQLFGKDVETMKQMLTTACSDEERAKNQLVKLQMILNEVRLKTRCHRLPSISSQYNADLQEGDRLIRRVRSVLEHTPLDVSELNADLQEAIDFIYKLYNNASNLVGIAIMVENAIVFGNRYRSSYPSIDSELTRAELSFQNGEYTKALKIAIQSREKMHPGIYEKLIKTNDPGIMNQAP